MQESGKEVSLWLNSWRCLLIFSSLNRITCPKVAKVCHNPIDLSFILPYMLVEMDEDKTLDGRHAIEEAMSAFFLDHLIHRFNFMPVLHTCFF